MSWVNSLFYVMKFVFCSVFRCKPIIFCCCENHEGYVSIVSGHSAEFLVLKPVEANTNKKDVKFQGFFMVTCRRFLIGISSNFQFFFAFLLPSTTKPDMVDVCTGISP